MEDHDFYVSCPTRCKRCVLKQQTAYAQRTKAWIKRYQREKNTEKYKVKEKRKRLRRYKVDEKWYVQKLIDQDYKCAICHKPTRDMTRSLSIDHDHLTLQTRGLLCYRCNLVIGFAMDDYKILLRAIDYLKQYRKVDVTG